jgi:hypothetical protein
MRSTEAGTYVLKTYSQSERPNTCAIKHRYTGLAVLLHHNMIQYAPIKLRNIYAGVHKRAHY